MVDTQIDLRTREDVRSKPTPALVADIASDIGLLARKEMQLAREEITEGVVARVIAIASMGVAGVFGLMALLFGGLAGAAALAYLLPGWAANLIVAGAFVLMAGPALLVARARAKRPSLAPTETARTLKEEVEWARQKLTH
jgi:hypothetical protein